MSGIALFVPDEDLLPMAEELLRKRPGHHVKIVKYIRSADAIQEARNVVNLDVDIIIARGQQAYYIRQNTSLPLVDIQLTAQELGLTINRGKALLGREHITIGLFGWSNMFCDTSHFEELFQIRLHTYLLESDADWQKYIVQARRDGCDLIIGSRSINQYDDLINMPHLYLRTTGESLGIAVDRAEALYNMAKQEQHNQAQFSAVLYSAASGIVKISDTGDVLLVNRHMEDILEMRADQIVGRPVFSLFPQLGEEKIRDVLSGAAENFSGFTECCGRRILVAVEPIAAAGQTDGAIISCTNLVQMKQGENLPMRGQLLKGNVALTTFEFLEHEFPDLKPVFDQARIYALSPSPMLIEATSGPELEMLAQSIHNESIRKNAPFVNVSLSGLSEQQQDLVLFGNPKTGERGAILDANHGTLMIQGIDKLPLPLQYQLVRVIRTRRLDYGISRSQVRSVDVRIIATTGKNLSMLRKNFQFRSDLLFVLKALRIRIPSLKDRPRDIEQMLDRFLRDFSRQYSSYHLLSDGARQAILSYSWEGNMIQLQAFCERMILTVQKRTITEEYVQKLLLEIYQQDSGIFDEPAELSFETEPAENLWGAGEDPIRNLIASTLKKNRGNRKETAKELRMSTTTLWRKMKAYHLE